MFSATASEEVFTDSGCNFDKQNTQCVLCSNFERFTPSAEVVKSATQRPEQCVKRQAPRKESEAALLILKRL